MKRQSKNMQFIQKKFISLFSQIIILIIVCSSHITSAHPLAEEIHYENVKTMSIRHNSTKTSNSVGFQMTRCKF